MKDEIKAKFLSDLITFEVFTAQQALEDEQMESLQSKLLAIDPKSDVKFEYARVRGSLEAIKGLQAKREHLIQSHRSRSNHS